MLTRYLYERHNSVGASAATRAAIKTKHGDDAQVKEDQAVKMLDAEMRAMTDSRILKEA